MTTETPVVIGNHYWLTFEGDRVPLILKVYNICENGTIGGIIYNIITGENSVSIGFSPSGSQWEAWREFEDTTNEELTTEVKTENIVEEIKEGDLAQLKQMAKLRIDYFFCGDVSQPLKEWPEPDEIIPSL